MRIALTGATGFIGRHIAKWLVDRGDHCRCLVRPSSDRGGFESIADQIEWFPGDLARRTDPSDFVEGCDAVVHSALDRPGTGFRGAEGDLSTFLETNLLGSIRLIEAARDAGVSRFVYLSTCAVHEKILDDRPLDETHPLWPRTHYGAHKAAVEKFVHSFGLGGDYDVCALRPSGVYGITRPPENSKWYPLIRAIVQGETVECKGGGKEVHAADVAKAVALLLTAANIKGEAFSCCDQYVSEYTVAHLARELSGSQSEIIGDPKTPRHQIETEKLRSIGMEFGGRDLLRKTIGQLVDFARSPI